MQRTFYNSFETFVLISPTPSPAQQEEKKKFATIANELTIVRLACSWLLTSFDFLTVNTHCTGEEFPR